MKDMIVIGGGPAGLCAALYGARGGLDVLVFEKAFAGGQAATTSEIDNYIGFDEGISGSELGERMEKHVRRFGVEIKYETITSLSLSGKVKKVVTAQGEYEAKTVILAMGAYPRALGLENENALRGSGVSYCATCDGMFFRNKPVAVVGGGDTAAEDALFLSRTSSEVYLIHRRNALRATKVLCDAIEKAENITVFWDSVVTEIHAPNGMVGSITVKNLNHGISTDVDISGLFVAVGTVPQSELVRGIVETDEAGYILTNEEMKTSIDGVYAVGDVRKKPLRQVITAASDGAVAAYCAARYISEGK